jgi:general secretion pathway protein C
MDSPDQSLSASSQQPSQQLARMIENSGIFFLPPASTKTIGSGNSAAAPAPPLDVARKIHLIGIASGESSGSAILEDAATKEQKLFRLHDSVPNIGELAAIDKDRVLFRSGEQEEWLTSVAVKALADAPRFPLPDQSGPQVVPPQPVPKPVRARNILDRRDLLEGLSDIPNVFRHAQAVSHFDNGKFAGIRFDAVNFYGFFGKIGLQSGDILKNINGLEIRDQTSLATVLQQLKLERRIMLDFIRNGEPRTLSYIVR